MQSIPPVLDPAAAHGLHALDVLTAARELRSRARAAILAGNLGPPATTRTPAHVTLAATTLLPALAHAAEALRRGWVLVGFGPRLAQRCADCGAAISEATCGWRAVRFAAGTVWLPDCLECQQERDAGVR